LHKSKNEFKQSLL
jgi:hypothetical protein